MSCGHHEPCPCEMNGADDNLAPVSDEENLVKIVALRDHILISDSGAIELTSTAIREDDIAGRTDRSGNTRSVSTFRINLATPEELERRAKAINKVREWENDPVSAIVSTKALRDILDQSARREVCVYAEPTGENDRLGPCKFHAGIKRSLSPPIPKDRLTWAVLRLTVAQKFKEFKHICSDTDATLTTIK